MAQQVQDIPRTGYALRFLRTPHLFFTLSPSDRAWTLNGSPSDDALLTCTSSVNASQTNVLRFGAFGFHRYDLSAVQFARVRVRIDVTAGAALSARLTLVRVLPASPTNPNATVLESSFPRDSNGPEVSNRRSESEIVVSFDVASQLPLVAALGQRFFERGFAVEIGFSFNAGANNKLSLYSVAVDVQFVHQLTVTSIAPQMLPTRLGGDPVAVRGSGFRYFGGFVCRFGDLLATGALRINNTDAPTAAPTPFYGDTELTTVRTPEPTSYNGDAELVCIAPRQRASGIYKFQVSIDGGLTFSPDIVINMPIGNVTSLPSPLPANTIVVSAKQNDSAFEITSTDVKIDTKVAADQPVMQLAVGTTYRFIGNTHCDHAIYVSTGRGGSLANREDDSVLSDRLDNSKYRETCEGLSFEFTPTQSYPKDFYIASIRNSSYGRLIRLNKANNAVSAMQNAWMATLSAMALTTLLA